MLTVKVSSNYKKLSRSLGTLGRKQLPFAFAKTLNETTRAVEKYTVAQTYPRAFDVRNPAKGPSTWAGLTGLAAVFEVAAEQWSMIGDAIAAAIAMFVSEANAK